MRGMILAGGKSTRLYPLTLDLPKPLVPVLDRPVVDHIIDYLASHGVDDVVINVHYFAEQIEAYIGDGSRWGVAMTYLREKELMGSAGAVKQVASRFGETFLVIGCDDVTDVDLSEAVRFHRERGAEATIVLHEADEVSQYGVVVTDESGRITGFQEKPAPGTERSRLVNTGIYIFEPSVLDRIPANTFFDFGKQVFPEMLAAGARFYGMRTSSYWCDIGTPGEYRRCHFDALDGRVRLRQRDGAVIRDGVLLGPDARVDKAANVMRPAAIGARSRIESGAVVERSILWDDVVIEAGATVRDAVLGEGVRVASGSTVTGGEYGKATSVA
ncbi:MAG TPA: NDP-sugar synthase [Candidatus Eremiobacteraceae bacterium]|nr:NDP-sugar synthase [Candidatus Eremiobacteraceae bacterium]